MKTKFSKYAGVVLTSAVIIGGIASAAITPIPTISNTFAVAGQAIKAIDINKLAEAINILDTRTNGSQDFDFGTQKGINLKDPVSNTDAVNKQAMDAAIAAALANYAPTPCGLPSGSDITFGGLTYKTIVSCATGKVWLDRNLGATQSCTSSTDTACYGDYYQWGRPADGHEKSTSATTSTQSPTITPTHGLFIFGITGSGDWTTGDNAGTLRSAYFAKTDGTGVCPPGFHVPTSSEFSDENITSANSAFTRLKIPLAGHRNRSTGAIQNVGVDLYLKSSTPDASTSSRILSTTGVSGMDRAYGASLRCVQ